MSKRRSRGDGGLYWSESRKRWIAEITVGFTPSGKRITKKGSGKTKTAAKNRLKEIIDDYENGIRIVEERSYTVAKAVQDWLTNYERSGHDTSTVRTVRSLVNNHIVPDIGARKLAELSADDVDEWLAAKAAVM